MHKEAIIVDDLQEEEYGATDETQARDDARLYAERQRREEKVAWQAQVNNAPLHEDYVPANTWDGLEMVGGEKEWDTGRKFKSFLAPACKLGSPEEMTVAIYRSIVEVFAALGAGRAPRTSLNYITGPLVSDAARVKVDLTQASDPEGPGKVRLSYPNAVVEQAVLRAGSPSVLQDIEPSNDIDDASDAIISRSARSSPDSLRELIQSWGHSWQHISLGDAKVKFAVIKRITRLTGMTIPDHTIHRADSVAWLIATLAKAPKTQKLFDTLVEDGRLAQLNNVSIKGRRQTPIDKETELGRWKMIEAELQRRDLPITGRS